MLLLASLFVSLLAAMLLALGGLRQFTSLRPLAESVVLHVRDGHVNVRARFRYANPSSWSVPVLFLHPFAGPPGTGGSPRDFTARDGAGRDLLKGRLGNTGWFVWTPPASGEGQVHLRYTSPLDGERVSYVTAMREACQRPLPLAEYVLDLPSGNRLLAMTYPCSRRENTYTVRRQDLVTEPNLEASWTSETPGR